MDIDSNEAEKKGEFTRILPEDCLEIDKLAEKMLAGLAFDTVYELAKRFHVHLVTMMFCEDTESYEELRGFYNDNPESDETRIVLAKLDTMVGFSGITDEEMESEVWADPIELPDKGFFKTLGLD